MSLPWKRTEIILLFLLWLRLFVLSGVTSPLISSSMLGAYQPGEFICQCPIFLPFHTVHGVFFLSFLFFFFLGFFLFFFKCLFGFFILFYFFYFTILYWFMGFSREKYWSGLPFPSPVDHVLSELSTMTCPSWVALHGMAHSFNELDKAVVHVIRLVSFLLLWLSVWLSSDEEG